MKIYTTSYISTFFYSDNWLYQINVNPVKFYKIIKTINPTDRLYYINYMISLWTITFIW